MSESLTKNALIGEIAGAVKLSKADVGRVLDRLTEIAGPSSILRNAWFQTTSC